MAYVPPEQVGADAEQRKKYDEQMKEMLRDPFWELKQAGNAATQKALEQKKQEASDAKTRAQIKALSGDTREAMDHAISLGSTVLDQWHTGAVQALSEFKPKIISNTADVSVALAGNLMWAATSIEMVPFKVLLSFVGATMGTLGSGPGSYDRILGGVTGSAQTRLNNLRDAFTSKLDVILFPRLQAMGLAGFSTLEHPKQLELIWTSLFRMIPYSTNSIEATKAFVLANLNRADQAAIAKLETYRKIWKSSLRASGSDIEGPVFSFDSSVWGGQTLDPPWIYAGSPINQIQTYHSPNQEPSLSAEEYEQRAASLLRLAVDQLWPFPA